MIRNSNGKVIKLAFGFNSWGIESVHGEKFEPVNLPDDFKQDGIFIVFSGSLERGIASINMWGKPIKITNIELAE